MPQFSRARVARLLMILGCALPIAAPAQVTPPLEPEPGAAAEKHDTPEKPAETKRADDAKGAKPVQDATTNRDETAADAKPPSGANTTSAPDVALDASAIVERADQVRFPKESFQVDVHVRSKSGDEELEPRLYRVSSKGNEDTIVQTLEPANERGQNMLMRGRDLWIFMPSVSQPVRLSLSQRLTGQVANGDLARANFAGDYTATLVGNETIDGVEHHVLELVAAQRGVTYPKVRYWVRVKDAAPYKAEFYSVSGRLLKTCSYEEFRPLGDRVRPTRLVMTDALKPGDVSVMEYSELKLVELPNRFFTKDYMKKLD